MRWNFQNYRDFILQTSTLLEQKFTNLYKLKPRGMNSRGPIENLICKMYDFIELWGLWHPIGILNGVFKITNLLKSRVPSVNISSKASSLGAGREKSHKRTYVLILFSRKPYHQYPIRDSYVFPVVKQW